MKRPASAANQVVRVGWLRAPNDLTLCKTLGTLEKTLAPHGVSVEWSGPFAAAAPAIEALNAGSIDITAGISTACITAFAAGIAMQIYAYQKMSPKAEGILVKRDSLLKSIGDLVGHSVAVNRGGTGEYLLMRALATNGIEASSVRRVYLSPSDSAPSFLQGDVDAWATWDPFVSIAQANYGARLLADGVMIGSENAVTLITSRAFAERNRQLLQVVFDAAIAANSWSQAHKVEAGEIWATEMNLPLTLAASLAANNAVPTTAVSASDIEQITHITEWFEASGLIQHKPEIGRNIIALTQATK